MKKPETERKFLVDRKKWEACERPEGVSYRQGYLLTGEDMTIRVRVAGTQGFLTIKGKREGFSRTEFEYPIPAGEAEDLLRISGKALVEKRRHIVIHEGRRWEVDDFEGENKGLLMAEIELDDPGEAFILPAWIDREVTFDERYYNAYLAQHPFREWA